MNRVQIHLIPGKSAPLSGRALGGYLKEVSALCQNCQDQDLNGGKRCLKSERSSEESTGGYRERTARLDISGPRERGIGREEYRHFDSPSPNVGHVQQEILG